MRRAPDPDQMLFRWVWEDDSPDPEQYNPPSDPPPLGWRVRYRSEPATATLWGVAVRVARAPHAPERSGDDRNPERKRAAL